MGTIAPVEFDYPEQTRAEREATERRQWWADNWRRVALYGGGAALLGTVAGWPLIKPRVSQAREKIGKYVRISKR